MRTAPLHCGWSEVDGEDGVNLATTTQDRVSSAVASNPIGFRPVRLPGSNFTRKGPPATNVRQVA